MSKAIKIRNPWEQDYHRVTAALDSWWDLPELQAPIHKGYRLGAVPRFYFRHFNSTCFLAEIEGQEELVGFLVGFQSPDPPNEAYIHFVGVNPKARRLGLASKLYNAFMEAMQARGVDTFRCLTDIDNTPSQAFHTAQGFKAETGEAVRDGVRFHPDYDGPDLHRVVFVYRVGEGKAPRRSHWNKRTTVVDTTHTTGSMP